MIPNKALRDQIRQRAAFACEYCGQPFPTFDTNL